MHSTHVLSILVHNRFGVLSRVAGMFSRRGFNIDSLSVGATEDASKSRMTISVRGDEATLDQIEKQLRKLEEVVDVTLLSGGSAVLREHVLIKVGASGAVRSSVMEVVDIFRARIVDVASEIVTVELTGSPSKITAFIELMRSYEIKSLVRTGLTGLLRGNAFSRSE